jgi:pilus assembly protein Flp/PilA
VIVRSTALPFVLAMAVREGEARVKNLLERVRALRTGRDDGATAVEYGLLVALIAVVIASTVAILGGVLNSQFNEACTQVQGNTTNDTCEAPGNGNPTP